MPCPLAQLWNLDSLFNGYFRNLEVPSSLGTQLFSKLPFSEFSPFCYSYFTLLFDLFALINLFNNCIKCLLCADTILCHGDSVSKPECLFLWSLHFGGGRHTKLKETNESISDSGKCNRNDETTG